MKKKTYVLWLVAILVVASGVWGLPLFINYQLSKTLGELLEQPVEITRLGFNPFIGTAAVDGLSIGGNDVLQEARVNIKILPLLQRQVYVQSVSLSDVNLPVTIAGSEIVIAGYTLPKESSAPPSSEPPAEPWQIIVDEAMLARVGLTVNHEGQSHVIALESLTLRDFDTTLVEPSPILASLQINGAPVTLDGNVITLTDRQQFNGKLMVNSLNLGTIAPVSDLVTGVLSLEQSFSFDRSSDGNIVARSEGALGVTDLAGFDASVAAIDWQGGVAYADGRVELRGQLETRSLVSEVALARSITVDGDVFAVIEAPRSDAEWLGFDGRLEVQGATAEPYGDMESLLWNGTLAMKGADRIEVTGDTNLSRLNPLGMGVIDRIEAAEGRVLLNDGALVSAALSRFSIVGMDLLAERRSDGEMAMLARLPKSKAEGSSSAEGSLSAEGSTSAEGSLPAEGSISAEGSLSAEGSTPTSDWPELQVGLFEVQESRVEFVDLSVEPKVDFKLEDIVLSARDVTLSEPFDFQFAGDHQTETGLEARLDINGRFNVMTRTGNVDLALSNFELHEISPYLGSGIRSGRLQLDSKLKMDQGNMVVNNQVKIQNVKVDKSPESDRGQMPLSTALFLLKDKNDVVELEVPIESNLQRFEVGFGDIIRRAVGKAARTTAVTYAQYALQPFGSLLLARDLLGAVTRPRFEPIEFETASSELTGESEAYAAKLAELLSNKEDLTVTICGYAGMEEVDAVLAKRAEASADEGASADSDSNTKLAGAGTEGALSPEEKEARNRALIKSLAEARGRAVQEALTDAGIAGQRLYACTAGVESGDSKESGEASPRVEIAL